LTIEQQRLFRLAGVLGQGEYRVGALAAILDRAESDVATDMDKMVDFGLMSHDEASGYRLEPLIHSFAQSVAKSGEDFERFYQAAHHYYFSWLDSIEKLDDFGETEDEFKHLRFLFDQALELEDWQTVHQYHELTTTPSELRINIAGHNVLVYGIESIIPFPSLEIQVEGGILVKIDAPGGRGKDLVCEHSMLSYMSLPGAHLRNIVIEHGVLAQCDFRGAVMRDIVAEHSNIANLDLRGAELRDLVLEHTDASAIDLRNALCRDIHLKHSKMIQIRLEGAETRNIIVDNESILTTPDSLGPNSSE
jgi:hypothetical protein